MRTNIVISDELMEEAKKVSGLNTKKAIIEKALEIFIKRQKQLQIKSLKGQIVWEGDLDQMRDSQ